MTNQEAITALEVLVEQSQRAITTATWALAFLNFGGEATWDAVKDVSRAAEELGRSTKIVATLDRKFDQIVPF